MATAAPSMGPYVELLGEPAVTLASGQLLFQPDKRYFLLALLAYRRDWVTRKSLARLFWPEHDRSVARLNLRQLIKRTRRLSWQPELEMAGDDHDQRIRWLPNTDLEQLERALTSKDHETALRLYRGPLLAGLRADGAPEFAGWLDFERLRLQERWRDALLAHAAELGVTDSHHQAAYVLAAVLRQDEFDEEVLRTYMSSAAMAGHVKRALDAYDAFTRLLEAEIGLIPSTATQMLVQRIREGKLALDSASAPTSVPDLPSTGIAATSKRPNYARPTVNAAPPQLIGRELELSDLARQLGNAGCRLLTVTGPGGVGKSLLVSHAISELCDNYQDGAVFAPLESLPAGGSVPDAIAAALGLTSPAAVDLDPLERLVLALRDKRFLLVLDNIEHLEHATEVVARLLSGCPDLDVLTTSRERLELAEEWLLPLEGLAVPTAGANLNEALSFDAVRLFVKRAERVRPAFFLNEDDLPYVIDICRLVAGLPLGIELAAAWLQLLPCREVAKEISRDVDFLDRSPSDAAERHRSIRATFEYSWRRLEPVEQSTLCNLAVFKGDFDREAGTHVAAAKLPVLAALADRSLLTVRGDGRFSFHPLLRHYAFEKLSADKELLRRKQAAHGRYFLRLLTSTTGLRGEKQLTALAALDIAFEDLAAAWRWACAERRLNELALAADPLASLCVYRARYNEGLSLLSLALDDPFAEAAGATGLGELYVQRARLAERLGRYEESALDANRGLELLRQTEGRGKQTGGLQILGKLAVRTGRYAEAREIFTAALASAAAQGSHEAVARLLGSIGLAEQYLGRRARAAVWYRRSLRLQRELENPLGVVSALANLGNVLRLLRHPEAARELLDEALALAEHIDANDVLPSLHINLGVLVLDQGEPSLAAERFESALRLARRSGNRSLEVNAAFQLGKLALIVGDVAAGQQRFLDTLQLAGEIGHQEKVLDCLVGLAWARAQVGDVDRAERWLTSALEHRATSPGTRRWAGELRQALDRGLEPRSDTIGRRVNDGRALTRAVEKALLRSAP